MHIFDLPIRNTLEMRVSKNKRTFEELAPFVQFAPFVQLADLHPDFVSSIQILFVFVKKNKMKNFPTKMKGKIGAPKGRQLYGAPKWALIMPNSVLHLLSY